ncbi:hypothetical protein ABKN59_010572 [Abortiporus biennis]
MPLTGTPTWKIRLYKKNMMLIHLCRKPVVVQASSRGIHMLVSHSPVSHDSEPRAFPAAATLLQLSNARSMLPLPIGPPCIIYHR